MGLKEWLIPQEKLFFTLLEDESKIVVEGAQALKEMMNEFDNLSEKRKKLKEIERRGDEIVHEIYQRLNKTFITPIDHEDISALASRYDEVLDYIYAVANRLYLYEIHHPTEVMKQFSELVLQTVTEIDSAFSIMRRMNEEEINRRCIEIHRIENAADELLNESVANLFKTADVVTILKLKEIYEFLEAITDKCEDVSDKIRDIVLKQS